MAQPHPTRRAALFTFADARGNNPHGTRETAYDEGRRLNAGRYETVQALDRALDARARPRPVLRTLAGPPTEPAPTGIVGILALMAVGAGIAYVLMKKPGEGDEEDDEFLPHVAPVATVAALPAPAPTTQTVTVLPAAPVAQPAPIPNPAPIVVVAPPPPPVVEAPKRRRRRAPAVA